MYKIFIKPLLFLLNPEKAHYFAMSMLTLVCKIPGAEKSLSLIYDIDQNSKLSKKVMGIDFPNPIGLAAGFDKDGKYYKELSQLGFGFIEIGTVTPLPQSGNEKPRLFRLGKDEALINRMGFNNDGLEAMVHRLSKQTHSKIIIGGNIGKNKITPNEEAVSDYLICLETLHDHVDYFVVNVSSPNTVGLRALQDKEPLTKILNELVKKNTSFLKPKPILLKIAPDLNDAQLDDIAEIILKTGIEGVIATNTTISREGLKTNEQELNEIGMGGLSGKPLRNRSTAIIKYLRSKLGSEKVIIGVGGIHNAGDAIEKLKNGADLIQIYTGFIYEGPKLIKSIKKTIIQAL